MPSWMKKTLISKLIAWLGEGNILVDRDSSDGQAYHCLHFSWYNRYTTNMWYVAEYKAMIKVLESLPGQPGSIASPFTSFVLNINVCTQGHRDIADKQLGHVKLLA
ncbi:hypothetical protein EDD15DRAFT_2201480 [Pisolithus albus]|nr:hypothetical protein EDD15DRAFT_2201480 [Pisolithus albus]